jgi:hypothetical protein
MVSSFPLLSPLSLLTKKKKKKKKKTQVTETLFSLLLQGYISALRAIKARSAKQKHVADVGVTSTHYIS